MSASPATEIDKVDRVDLREGFRQIAKFTSELMGSPGAFVVALLLIILWAASGHFFHYSDTWQLVINTATTIITFLMVFLIQSTQNRDSRAIHLKLAELIKSVRTARNSVIDIESLTDAQLKRLEDEYKKLCSEASTSTSVQ
jgi:low affinity Fe/Cu permease